MDGKRKTSLTVIEIRGFPITYYGQAQINNSAPMEAWMWHLAKNKELLIISRDIGAGELKYSLDSETYAPKKRTILFRLFLN